jgi:hypothetical protein
MSIGVVYIGLLLLGIVFAVISGALGWIADLGGGDIHLDVSGHLDAGHAHPISGTVVAAFITGFGAGGIAAHNALGLTLVPGLAVALAGGLLLAAVAFVTLELIFRQTQAGSEFDAAALGAREAEVITAIPAGGTGEVAASVKGQRETLAARSIDGEAIGKGRLVLIERVTGSLAHVRAQR